MAARRVVCATGHPCRRTCASTRRTFRGPATQLDPHPQADTGLGRDPPPTTPVSHASDKIGLNLSDCPIGGGGDCCADGRGAGAATRCPAPHPESVCPTHSALRLWLVLVAQIIRGAWRRREAPHTHTHTHKHPHAFLVVTVSEAGTPGPACIIRAAHPTEGSMRCFVAFRSESHT